jgi:hypothetical protein
MSSGVRTLPTCAGKKADGSSCERVIGSSSTYCYAHDPSRSSERTSNASRAAKSKLSSEIIAIRAEIREIMEAVKEGDMERGDAAVLLQGAGYLLKTVSEARKQSEYDEIRGEMAELRQLFEAQRGVYE